MGSGFPARPARPDNGGVVEVLRVTVGVLVAGSLLAIVGYVLAFVAAALWTLIRRPPADPLMEELERFLAGVLGREVTEAAPARGRRPRRGPRHQGGGAAAFSG